MLPIHDESSSNPLTEIGLALSMCFFSAFMLISVMKTTTQEAADTVKLNASTEADAEMTRPPVFLYRNQQFFRQDGSRIAIEAMTEQTMIIALAAETTVDEALRVREQLRPSEIQFATLPESSQLQPGDQSL